MHGKQAYAIEKWHQFSIYRTGIHSDHRRLNEHMWNGLKRLIGIFVDYTADMIAAGIARA